MASDAYPAATRPLGPRQVKSGAVTEVPFGSAQENADDELSIPEGRQAGGDGGSFREIYQQAVPVEPPRRRGIMPILGALLAVAVFATVVWFAYSWGLKDGFREEIPVIKAEAEPVKVKPEQPGGLIIPNQDKEVLNRGASGETAPGIERLLSSSETPQPPPKPAVEQAEAAIAADPEPGETAEPGANVVAAVETPTTQEPAANKTQEVPSVPEPSSAQPAAPAVVEPSLAPAAGADSPAEPHPEPVTGGGGGGEATAGSVQLAAISKGDYVIQLASVGSPEAAEGEWGRLQKVYPDLLGDMNLSVQQATVNGKVYHRIQTGPFPSRATAQDMCAQLAVKKQACIVQRR